MQDQDQDKGGKGDQGIPDESSPEQKITLSASVVLSALPSDATDVLTKYSSPSTKKVTVMFRAIGSAPILKQPIYTIGAEQKFAVLVKFLRRQLKYRNTDSLFCYINSSFAPGLDETIGNLINTVAIDGKLIVSYCNTVAFG